jgi:hypothetical protein
MTLRVLQGGMERTVVLRCNYLTDNAEAGPGHALRKQHIYLSLSLIASCVWIFSCNAMESRVTRDRIRCRGEQHNGLNIGSLLGPMEMGN